MKKVLKYLVAAAFMSSGLGLAYAACTNSDFACYESGPSQNLSQKFRIDASGNVSVAGTLTNTGTVTNSGLTVFTRQQVTGISSTTVTIPTATYMTVVSSGSPNVTCGGSFNFGVSPGGPCISTATATDGQWLVISATQATNAVILTSSTLNAMDLGSATRTIQLGKVLTLIYDGAVSMWKEVSYGNN